MDSPVIVCPKCKAPLPMERANAAEMAPCPGCRKPLRFSVFPALFNPPEAASTGEAISLENEAACFFHAQKKAVVACEGCGRYLCSLCDVETLGQHLCPSCVESGQRKEKLKSLVNRKVGYDRMALTVAIAPILIFYFTLFTAPAAIYIALRHWKDEVSIVPRHAKLRYVLAILIALAELAFWGFYFSSIFREQ